jgi:hypothetical protein
MEHRGAGSADEIPTVLAEQVRDDRLVRASGCVFSSPTEFELLSVMTGTFIEGDHSKGIFFTLETPRRVVVQVF